MQNKGKYYITTAIAYTSGRPHIGNTYEAILADCIARYKRADGYDVHFLTGSDEHGQKIETRAIEEGMSPQEFVDMTAGDIRRIWDRMNVSYNRFIRTTDEDHTVQIQKIFKRLYKQGDIYKGAYDGLYCTECEAFYTPSQLVDGRCPVCGEEVHPAKEEAYFFRMSKYAPRLIEYINEHPDFIQPVSRRNEMMNNFLLPGLQDLCVSRTSFQWGIPVDFDPGHVVYVWLDALCNYITGIGYDADGASTELYRKEWPADLHLIGKDIIRFHTIYWPIFLMALGEPLPKQVFGHPWLLQGGEKMSKSKGNVIYADDLADLFGVDAVRYFCVHEMPYENDGVITWDLLVERINSDLANTLGNLVKRTISMSNKYFGGVVEDRGAAEPVDKDLKAVCTAAYAKVEEDMDELRAADALTEIFAVYKRLNKYIDETEPWVLARDEAKAARLATVMYNLTEGIMMASSLLAPFMPATGEKIAAQLSAPLYDFSTLGSFGQYASGTKVDADPEMLFARLDRDAVLKQAEAIQERQRAEFEAHQKKAEENLAAAGRSRTGRTPVAGGAAEGKAAVSSGADKAAAGSTSPETLIRPAVSIEEFQKLQFKVGEVLECAAVPKSKKLLVFKVKVGDHDIRQIVSGIHKWYEPEELIGRKIMVVVNLQPATLAGLTSEGMILSAEDAEGNVCVMTPQNAGIAAGSEIC
ncbi:methionine--tRNA ligase [Lachnoclostridium sp. Marseille-P6806]|uniref:methionine--tRNA ligase n=1 Tax=Lachnoclostridium sp. Marseille-P6806 TaxID=2364793 RepID=UPI001031194B|nr:methionine--tRNA ligase [Lachnoclostridium sp. Marseille-P6806]